MPLSGFHRASALALVIAAALWLDSAGSSRAAEPQATPSARAIDELMAAAYPADQPGAAILVVHDGSVLFRKAYGMANLELAVPLQPEHVFALASLSKPFTAAAVLKLAEEGKL